MKKKKWNFLLIVLLLSTCLAQAKTRVYFSPQDNLNRVFLEEMKKATKSIDLAIYSFSDQEILDVLIAKQTQGVEVRVLKEKATKHKRFLEPLYQVGAAIGWHKKINHHKFALIDGKILLNSSGNLGSSKLGASYDENLTVTDDRDFLEAYASEFTALLDVQMPYEPDRYKENPLEDSDSLSPVHHIFEDLALFTSANFLATFVKRSGSVAFKVIESELDLGAVESRLIQGVDSAQHTLQVATGHFRSKPLFEALKRAVQRGVFVQVILDHQEYLTKSREKKQKAEIKKCLDLQSEWECYREGALFSRLLETAGVDVRIKTYGMKWLFAKAPQMHHKYMLVDSQRLYTGSYNWSYNAEFNTFENVAIYDHVKFPEVIAAFEKNFEYLKDYGDQPVMESFEALLKQFKDPAKKELPLYFSPMTLTNAQIDQLRGVFFERCPRLPVSGSVCVVQP